MDVRSLLPISVPQDIYLSTRMIHGSAGHNGGGGDALLLWFAAGPSRRSAGTGSTVHVHRRYILSPACNFEYSMI